MGFAPLAFSVHRFVNSVGADAGFASIIGLAVLILLYFAQARETASLRSHAREAAERIQELEGRVAQLSRPQQEPAATAPPMAATSAPARAAASLGAGAIAASRGIGQQPLYAGAPAAPAGVAAPALSAATKLIPTPEPAVPARAGQLAATGAGTLPPATTPPGTTPPPGATPAPATVAAGGAGLGAAAGGGSNGASSQATGSATEAPPPRVQIQPGATVPPAGAIPPGASIPRGGAVPPGATIPPGRRPAPPTRGRPPRRRVSRRLIGVLIGVVAVAAIAAAAIVLTHGSGNKVQTTSTAAKATSAGRQRARPVAVNPATVTVSVLNGTSTTGLAGQVSQRLTAAGYKQGAVLTAADQTHTTTIVGYMPGFRQDALAVARSLKLKPAAVSPVDQQAQQVACQGQTSCNANVIVTLGTNLATGQ